MAKESNFKTAVNELMNGKVRTDDPEYGSPQLSADNPSFRAGPSTFSPPSYGDPSELISVLSSDIIIEGSVKSKSDIKVNGYVKGDISCGGTVVSLGTVDGNIEAANITLNGSTVTGNINVRGAISIDSGSSVTGDISGTNLLSDGKIKGNVILMESIGLHANASVYGNIKAKNISIEAGSTLVGNLEIKSSATNGSGPHTSPPPRHEPAEEQPTGLAEKDEEGLSELL